MLSGGYGGVIICMLTGGSGGVVIYRSEPPGSLSMNAYSVDYELWLWPAHYYFLTRLH